MTFQSMIKTSISFDKIEKELRSVEYTVDFFNDIFAIDTNVNSDSCRK